MQQLTMGMSVSQIIYCNYELIKFGIISDSLYIYIISHKYSHSLSCTGNLFTGKLSTGQDYRQRQLILGFFGVTDKLILVISD